MYPRPADRPPPAHEDHPITALRRPGRGLAAALLPLLLGALAACGSTRTYETDPHALLREAKAAVDAAPSLHFHISSENARGSGAYITGGDGDAKRPDGFSGQVSVVVGGLPLRIGILSSGGGFWVQLPFSSSWTSTDPGTYGFEDPAKLIDRDHGLTSLLAAATSARLLDRDRLDGEELYEIDAQLPGEQVATLLPDAAPSQPVAGRIGIAVDTHQVRRVVLSGPIFDAHQLSTYTLVLDSYGKDVSITPPAGG